MKIAGAVTKLLLLAIMSNPVFTQEYGIVGEVNLDSLVRHVEILSGERAVVINSNTVTIVSRHANDPGNDQAADYIQQQLERYGLTVTNQIYSPTGRNVFAIQTGTDYPDQQIIIGAHYDSMPAGAISPGADDNASGVAAVLESARILFTRDISYTLIYALWDEEELGVWGSEAYAIEASANNDQIICMVNVDMIGWDSNDDGVFLINTMEHSLDYSNSALSTNDRFDIELTPQIVNPGSGSDNLPFWWNGFQAIGFEEDYFNDWNANYHTTDDRIENFNLPFFHNCAKVIIGTVATLAQGYQEFSQINYNNLLNDTEEIANSNPVSIIISESNDYPLDYSTLKIISGLDGSFTDSTAMTPSGEEDIYVGNIPASNAAGIIGYFISVHTLDGLGIREPYGAPLQYHSFNVGPDHIPPQIDYISNIVDQLYPNGSEDIMVQATDNIGVQSVAIKWRINDGEIESALAAYQPDLVYYIGTLEWSSVETGDSISYWVEVIDSSSNHNLAISEGQSFSISSHYYIGDFEGQIPETNWELGSWGVQFFNQDYGNCLNDSPGERYQPNSINQCTLKDALNLTYFDHAYLNFCSISALELNHDFGYLQVSTDSISWENKASVTGLWEIEDTYISLDDLIGEDSVYIRLLMTSDSTVEYFGWYVDDIVLVLNQEMPASSIDDGTSIPGSFVLFQNYPNPFNPTTTIQYELPNRSNVQITIYDLLGKKVATLVSETQAAGFKSVQWDATNVPSGVYFYRITARFNSDKVSRTITKKLLLLK